MTLIRLENARSSLVRVDSVMESAGGRVRERRRANAQEGYVEKRFRLIEVLMYHISLKRGFV